MTAAIKTRATEHDAPALPPFPPLDGLPAADLELTDPVVKLDLVALAATVTFLFADIRTRPYSPEGTGRAAFRLEFTVRPPGFKTWGRLAAVKGTDAREPSEWTVTGECERYEWDRTDGGLVPGWRSERHPTRDYGKLIAKARRSAASLGRLALVKAVATETQADILAAFIAEKKAEARTLTERACDIVSENDNHDAGAKLLHEAHAANEAVGLIEDVADRLGIKLPKPTGDD